MPIIRALLIAVLMSCPGISFAAAPATQPDTVTRVERVMIISVDGLRPDILLRADAPNLRALMAAGSFSLFARTEPFAYTLPAHMSMLTGVTTEKHGISWNDYTEGAYSNVPTLFDLAKRKGFSTAIATSKMKFVTLDRPAEGGNPKTLDHRFLANEESEHDPETATIAAKMVAEHKPQVMFVHFGEVDIAGHASGWGSQEQLDAVKRVDVQVGRVVEAMRKANVFDQTLLIVSTDHGGSGRGHGPDDLQSMLIPWIAVGPGVRKNFDLTQLRGEPIRTYDTFATACAALGIDIPAGVEGKPVTAAYFPGELLKVMEPW